MSLENSRFNIHNIDCRFIDLIDRLLMGLQPICENDFQLERLGHIFPYLSSGEVSFYQVLVDIFQQYPFQANDDAIQQLQMASAVIFQQRKKHRKGQEKKESETLLEKKFRLASPNCVDLADLLSAFVFFHQDEHSIGKNCLLDLSILLLYLYNNQEEWKNDLNAPKREIYKEREALLTTLKLPTHQFRQPPLSSDEMAELVENCTFSLDFKWCAIFLSSFGSFDFYLPKENLSEMKAKQLSKKICRATEPYTWKETAQLFGDKLAFAMIDPKHPPLMVLHGTPYMRLTEHTKAIAKILKKQGYRQITIDGRRFASRNEEPYPLFGSPSVWSGSRPGLLTSFVYDNPKSLVIIEDADKMNPVIFETLAGAFKNENIISDEYGLENRNRDKRDMSMPATPVDFSHTVFILTTSAGSHFYERPDIGEFPLNALESRAFAGLESAMFTPSGKTESSDPTFSAEFLDLMRNGLIPMPPLNIKSRVDYYAETFCQELTLQAESLDCTFSCEDKKLKKITAALLLSEQHNRRSFEDLATEIIRPAFMANGEGKEISLTISKKAEETLLPYLDIDQPQSYLQKRGKTLTPIFTLRGREYILNELKEEKIYRQREHEGSVRLLADYPKTRFTDVYGHQKIKEKLQEIIELLKEENNEDAQRGVLLAGEPGVGKTMMAEAFAGEAQMAFVNVTGSELLYPDAATRLQEILEKHSPCVVFIDEADSIPSRASNSDYAPAVNRLLAMIQGINTDSNQAFWILATNYPERLDAALLRAGRIEDTLHMRAPRDLKAREEYLQHFPLTDKQRQLLAKITIGFTGAMFEQLQRKVKRLKKLQKAIYKTDLYQLVIEIQHGDDMNSRPASEEYERCTAYHEAGHAVAQLCLGVNTAHLMLVLHNGEAVSGYLQTIDEEIRDSTPESVEKDLMVYLAGRGAEELIFGAATMGCSSDLKRAGELAYYAAAKVGFMPEKTGLYISPLTYKSEDVEKAYEQAAAEMIEAAWQKIQTLLAEKEPLLREIAEKLIKKRLLDNDDLRKMHQKFESKQQEKR